MAGPFRYCVRSTGVEKVIGRGSSMPLTVYCLLFQQRELMDFLLIILIHYVIYL